MPHRTFIIAAVRTILPVILLVFAAAPFLGAEAGDGVAREMVLTGRYLNLPVKTGAPKQVLRLMVEGKTVREFEVELATDKPSFWVFVDVAPWKGSRAVLRCEGANTNPGALAVIESGDAIKDAKNLYAEKQRPQFHFTSKRGRLNDPNGPLFYQGEYHLFYQLHPYGWNSANKHWGHAVSRDLVRWQELSIALYPDDLGEMFSGSGVVDWKNTSGFQTGAEPPLVLIFTGAKHPRTQGIAYSNDRGRTWVKYAGNPVLPNIARGNRDPRVFWHEPTQRWVMALYVSHPDNKPVPKGGKPTATRTISLFTSPNLKQWTPTSRVEGFFECPDLFELPLDGDAGKCRWVLQDGSGHYMVGAFDGAVFTPQTKRLAGHQGDAFYGSQTFSDAPDGRRVQIGWARMSGASFEGMPFNQMMNLPCDLSLKSTPAGPRLARLPVREIETLRKHRHTIQARAVKPGENPLSAIACEFLDLRLDIAMESAREIALKVRGATLLYDVAKQKLTCGRNSAALPLSEGRLQFRVLVDRALMELFAAGGLVYMPIAVPPAKEPAPNLHLSVRDGAARIVSIEVDELNSIWPSSRATVTETGLLK
jgi:sucrose-6-phosphate hydrolase SacC (GH32 family)